MDNVSILDQIINTQKTEDAAKLNVVEIVRNLLSNLSERERDVIMRRFGLHGQGFETLENVGQAHGLTRERIRQIESAGVKKIVKLEDLEKQIENLRNVITQLLEEHGGFIEKDYLLDLLITFSVESEGSRSEENDYKIHKNHLDFLISKLLDNKFEEVANSPHFKKSFKLKYQDLDHLEELAKELIEKIGEAKQIYKTEEIIDLAKQLSTYEKHQEKLGRENVLDLSRVFLRRKFSEKAEVINENKAIYSVLRALKNLDQNNFGHWGLGDWKEIKPKTINDKIYLILKNNGQPMHFVEIAGKINEIKFDGKRANPATVHNELILDNKYVLIGRGIYGLRDWGYEKGTVADVIREIFNNSEEPLSREEIVKRVLEKRRVKEATIILALMNKDYFEKVDGGKYQLKK